MSNPLPVFINQHMPFKLSPDQEATLTQDLNFYLGRFVSDGIDFLAEAQALRNAVGLGHKIGAVREYYAETVSTLKRINLQSDVHFSGVSTTVLDPTTPNTLKRMFYYNIQSRKGRWWSIEFRLFVEFADATPKANMLSWGALIDVNVHQRRVEHLFKWLSDYNMLTRMHLASE